jgi:alkylhydroperoxidase/carboxymuconolactone decarboxylase family protein YurZ
VGWRYRGNSIGRRRQNPGGPEALARSVAPDVHDPYRHHRATRWHCSAVDGKGQRRAIQVPAPTFESARTVGKPATNTCTGIGSQLPPQMRHEPRRSPRNLVPSRRSSCSSPTMWSSAISGGAPILVTIVALAAMGDDDQLDVYLRRGLESGLTRAQITEALTHLAFYAGWPRATKAMTAVARTLGK